MTHRMTWLLRNAVDVVVYVIVASLLLSSASGWYTLTDRFV